MSDFGAASPAVNPSDQYLTVLILFEKKERATDPADSDESPRRRKVFALPFRLENSHEEDPSRISGHPVAPPIEISMGRRGIRRLKAILNFVNPNVVHAYSDRALDAFIRARPPYLRCREIWTQQVNPGDSTSARAVMSLRRQWHFLFYRFGLILQESTDTMPPQGSWPTIFLDEKLEVPWTLEDTLELRLDLLAAYRQRTIAVFTRYHRDGASSRVRHFQFDHQEELSNYRLYFFPLLAENYLKHRYSGKIAFFSVFWSYLKRVCLLQFSRFADILWIEKEALPWTPHRFETMLSPKLPTVLDFDDAVFEQYLQIPNKVAAFFLRDKSFRLAQAVTAVTVGNPYLHTMFHINAQVSPEIIPSVVEIPPIDLSRRRPNPDKLVLAWVGTPVTFRQYLEPMWEFLVDFAREQGGEMWIIGGPETSKEIPSVKFFQWYEGIENEIFPVVSVGIMPLSDDPWSRGKCGYKLLQYMSHGIPVVASPVGVNKEIVRHGENGFLASSLEDWRHCLLEISENPSLRNSMGQAGRKLTEDSYAIAHAASQLRSVFDSL